MDNIIFKKINSEYIAQLNTWQQKEQERGSKGLEDFVVPRNSLLGDYLTYIDDNLNDILVLLAFEKGNLIGFICATNSSLEHCHVEIMGVNPDFRGHGYAMKILEQFKKQAEENGDIKSLTLSVRKNNKIGQKAFSKIGKLAKNQPEGNYLSFEI